MHFANDIFNYRFFKTKIDKKVNVLNSGARREPRHASRVQSLLKVKRIFSRENAKILLKKAIRCYLTILFYYIYNGQTGTTLITF